MRGVHIESVGRGIHVGDHGYLREGSGVIDKNLRGAGAGLLQNVKLLRGRVEDHVPDQAWYGQRLRHCVGCRVHHHNQTCSRSRRNPRQVGRSAECDVGFCPGDEKARAAVRLIAAVHVAHSCRDRKRPLPVPAGMGYVNIGDEPNRSRGSFVSGTKMYIAFSGPPNLPGVQPGPTTGLIVVVDATTDTVAQTLPIPGLIGDMVFNPATQKFAFWSRPAPAPRRFSCITPPRLLR